MNIVFALCDNVTQLDFTGPVQFLSRLPGAVVHVVSKDGQAVTTDCGFSILPRSGFAEEETVGNLRRRKKGSQVKSAAHESGICLKFRQMPWP
jgi:transcriptional regulator GlxA family with amidase domain